MSASKHELNRTVRDYLLEIASPHAMLSFEDRYFTDSEFLKLLEAEEERLIEDFLIGRLPRTEKERFERICQRDTSLAQKVAIGRARLSLSTDKPRESNRFWLYGVALAATAACVLFVSTYFLLRPHPKQLEAKVQAPPAERFAEIRLSPGLNKGVSKAPLIVPAGTDRLRMILEMPGILGPVSCKVKLLRIESDGHRTDVASSNLVLSRPGSNTEAVFIFDGIRMSRGDFIAELVSPEGTVLDRYLFKSR